ncbi:hypothetical protein EMIT0P265_30583 [Pseudomonas zeae]
MHFKGGSEPAREGVLIAAEDVSAMWSFAALSPLKAARWLYSVRSAWSAHQESSCSPPYN